MHTDVTMPIGLSATNKIMHHLKFSHEKKLATVMQPFVKIL